MDATDRFVERDHLVHFDEDRLVAVGDKRNVVGGGSRAAGHAFEDIPKGGARGLGASPEHRCPVRKAGSFDATTAQQLQPVIVLCELISALGGPGAPQGAGSGSAASHNRTGADRRLRGPDPRNPHREDRTGGKTPHRAASGRRFRRAISNRPGFRRKPPETIGFWRPEAPQTGPQTALWWTAARGAKCGLSNRWNCPPLQDFAPP